MIFRKRHGRKAIDPTVGLRFEPPLVLLIVRPRVKGNRPIACGIPGAQALTIMDER